jgi:hypothetical protein
MERDAECFEAPGKWARMRELVCFHFDSGLFWFEASGDPPRFEAVGVSLSSRVATE